MPLYSVNRKVGQISQEEIDASGFRAIVCAFQFAGLRWHRSYWDVAAGQLNCIYEAENTHQIEEHSRVARIPCDSVFEVREVRPEPYIHG